MRYLLAAVIAVALLTPWVRADLSPSGSVVVEAAHAGAIVSTAATTAVKGTAGTLRRIVFGTQVASATIKLFDLASASCTGTPSTNPKGVITLPSTVGLPFFLDYHLSFANGICVLTSGATNLAVIYD